VNDAALRARWGEALRETDREGAALCGALARRMRERRLTFGGRLLCPFLRPFFIDARDEARIARAAETIAVLGERVAREAPGWPELLDELGLTSGERRLISIDPGYGTASTASRADAFLLPDSLQFAEYNAESPAGAGYSQLLADVFAESEPMARFRETFDTRRHPTIERLLDALLASYREWGGRARPPRMAIVDWREVPTWSEFELLADAFGAAGVPTVIADPRDLVFDGSRLMAGDVSIDLVYRRVLVNDIVARAAECRQLVDACARGAVCMANTFRCKLPHKKTFFAVLTDERFERLCDAAERAIVRAHVPWTRRVRDGATTHEGRRIDLLPYARGNRDGLVLKPSDEYGGTGVVLGWETPPNNWDAALQAALTDSRAWILQERIAVRREPFPICEPDGVREQEMLVDLAPFLFRGRLSGYLTRLSATGLANVTSGGGQVPAFVVTSRMPPPVVRRDVTSERPDL
jgi:uncharacterized circularly permuted ATP-grasp superfamily protein